MLTATAITMIALAAIVYAAARNALFPPVMFCAIWSLILVGLMVAGQALYPVSEYALLVFVVGAVAFACGALAALCILPGIPARGDSAEAPSRLTRLALDVLLLALIAALPFYIRTALSIASQEPTSGILVLATIRKHMVAAGDNPFGPVASNLNVLAPLVALAMAYETDGSPGRRWRAIAAALLALGYNSLTGSKNGVYVLVELFFLAQIRARRIRIGHAAGIFAAFLTLFAGMVFLINYVGFTFQTTESLVEQVGEGAASYVLGAPISFAAIAEKPDTLASSESIGRFFMESARSLGADVDVANINERYTPIAPGLSTNTYTIYFSYFKDYGWSGTVLLMLTLGMMLTFIWWRAMCGGAIAVLMYSILCKSIVESFYAEDFYVNLNGLLKALALFSLLYVVLPAGERRRVAPVPA